MPTQFTLIWQDDQLMVGTETYTARSMADAITQWESDTHNCALIGVIEGAPRILFWEG